MAIVAGACGDGGTGSSGETGGDSGSVASTTEAEGTGSESTTGAVEPTTGEAASSGETGAVEPTTGEAASSGGTEDLCADFCDAAVACAPELDVASCIDASCFAEEDPTAACVAAIDARHLCLASMDCDDMLAWLEGEDPGPCAGALAEEVEQCTGMKACEYLAEGTIDGTTCTIDFACLLEPPQSMQCDAETCTCVEDGRTVGTCESAEICASWTDAETVQLLVEKAATCCGFGNAA